MFGTTPHKDILPTQVEKKQNADGGRRMRAARGGIAWGQNAEAAPGRFPYGARGAPSNRTSARSAG